MFPPKSFFFPEYHKSISRLFQLVVFSWNRPTSTILPSRMTYGVPSAKAPTAGRVVRLVDCRLRHLLQPEDWSSQGGGGRLPPWAQSLGRHAGQRTFP